MRGGLEGEGESIRGGKDESMRDEVRRKRVLGRGGGGGYEG